MAMTIGLTIGENSWMAVTIGLTIGEKTFRDH